MKYSLECDVTGKIKIDKTIEVTEEDKTYILMADSKGFLSSVKIVVKLSNSQGFGSRLEPGKGKVAAVLTIEEDPEQYQNLIRELQELESVISFDSGGCLKSINWATPKVEIIPESDEEKERVAVHAYHFKKEYAPRIGRITEEQLRGTIRSKHLYRTLIIPKAFFREGANEFEQRRYINAFYNFYFVLEDLFGMGKTKNKQVASAFRRSKEFLDYVKWAKGHIDMDKRHRGNIERACAEENVTYDIDGLIDLLLKVRGKLHHYSSKSSKHKGSPLNHDDFESIAFFTMGLAARSILGNIVKINQAEKAKKLSI